MAAIKIIKVIPRTWAGTGFGTRSAAYGVEGRSDIRIMRESHGWTAYTSNGKLFDTSKAGLEIQLNGVNHV
jgi:hypothetical protein